MRNMSLEWKSLTPPKPAIPKEHIKQLVSIIDAVRQYTGQDIKNNRCKCPFCDGTRPDTLVINLKSNRYHCFRCGADGDQIDLVSALYGFRFADAVQKIASDYGLENASEDVQRAADAARSLARVREAQRREAAENLHRWQDLWITYDNWLRSYPPGDSRHDTAEREITIVSYKWDAAEARLNSLS